MEEGKPISRHWHRWKRNIHKSV